MPTIVIQNINPVAAFPTAIGIPDTSNHIILARRLTVPPPYTTSFPNGKNANPANLKHCRPIGIPMMDMHHRQPAAIHDSPLNNPPHINQSMFPNTLMSIFLLYLFIYSIHFLKCVKVLRTLYQHYLLYLACMDILKTSNLLSSTYTCFNYWFLIIPIICLCYCFLLKQPQL